MAEPPLLAGFQLMMAEFLVTFFTTKPVGAAGNTAEVFTFSDLLTAEDPIAFTALTLTAY